MGFFAWFLIVSLAEMATFFWVQSQIGLGWALALAVFTAVLGSFLVRRTGVSVFSRVRDKLDRGQIPGRELGDGAAVLVAGAFLISPGFITDLLGFLLLVPAVRRIVYDRVSRRFGGTVRVFSSHATRGGVDRLEGEDIIEVESWE